MDIDGVLNSSEYFKSVGYNKKLGFNDIDVTKVILLKQIYDTCNAKIVLSSSWRGLIGTKHYSYLEKILHKHSMNIMSHTPIIEQNRPLEIKSWLENMPNKSDIKFISLDDDYSYQDYCKYGIGNCLVKTSFYEPNGGLRQEHVNKAIKILMGK